MTVSQWTMWFLCRVERGTEEYLRGGLHLPLFLHIFISFFLFVVFLSICWNVFVLALRERARDWRVFERERRPPPSLFIEQIQNCFIFLFGFYLCWGVIFDFEHGLVFPFNVFVDLLSGLSVTSRNFSHIWTTKTIET